MTKCVLSTIGMSIGGSPAKTRYEISSMTKNTAAATVNLAYRSSSGAAGGAGLRHNADAWGEQ